MKRQKVFSLTTEVFAQAVRALKEVGDLDDSKRVLVSPVGNAVIFSCVGGGMFLNYAVPAEVENETKLLLSSIDLSVVASGIKVTRGSQKSEPINFYLEKQRGGSKAVLEFRTVHGDDIKVNNVKRIPTKSLVSSPQIPPMPKEDRLNISSDDLLSLTSRVCSIASNDNNNPSFCGCNLTLTGSDIVFASTNGVCLSDVRKSFTSKPDIGCLIPQKFCVKVKRVFQPEQNLEMHISDKLFFVKSEYAMFGTTLINAKFPEYNKLISEKDNYVDIDSSILFECLSSFSQIVLADQYKRVSLLFDVSTMSIESMGSSTSNIPIIESSVSESTIIDVNLQLFITLLKSVSSKIVRIGFDQQNSPIMLEPIGDDVTVNHVSLLVPLVREDI